MLDPQDVLSPEQIMQMVPVIASTLNMDMMQVMSAVTKAVASHMEHLEKASRELCNSQWRLQMRHECR